MTTTRLIATSGLSTLEVEEPDLIIYRMRGEFRVPDLIAFREADGQWNRGKRYVLVLVDSRESIASDFQTRKASMDPPIGTRNRAMAIFGTSAALRGPTNLMMRALYVLSKGQFHSRLFADEESARQWLYAQREFLISRQDQF